MKNLKTIKQTKVGTIFFNAVITIIISCSFSFYADAQSELGIYKEDMIDFSHPPVIADITVSSTTNNTSVINERAAKILQKDFTDAGHPSWYEISNGIIASFDKDSIKTKLYFDKKGKLNYSVKFYNENLLSQSIRYIIKSIYYNYSILSTAEIHPVNMDGQTTYIILICDTKTLKVLTISDNEIVAVKSYNKA